MSVMAQHPDQQTFDRARPRAVGWWLLSCCAVLLALVMVGGATRLTESGLSIVDWKPVTGILPPIGESEWQAEFGRYQESPQYSAVNHGMDLGEFKTIFWFEYVHRLLARVLGLWFALPLAWFWLRGAIPGNLRWPLLGILVLGGAQGYLGWYMVKSGLVDVPRVSPYRLAAHLGLALIVYALMLRIALGLLLARTRAAVENAESAWPGGILLTLVALTIVFGAFVAGLRAGLMYNTFPLMAGQWVPPNLLALQPAWTNFFENPVTVQFVHRLLALTTLATTLWIWWRLRGRAQDCAQARSRHALLAMALLQVTLGICTLLWFVPVWLGTLHQGGAVLLLSSVLVAGYCWTSRPARKM
ncbi:COX15/CtaA family protein [Dokdonella sp.]|uniref:COX15/CtaA family protein n=1 Tax=Dokdonella sp. TaxID=2291710 RepID=UPI00352860B2